jgi:hypothetical protein
LRLSGDVAQIRIDRPLGAITSIEGQMRQTPEKVTNPSP